MKKIFLDTTLIAAAACGGCATAPMEGGIAGVIAPGVTAELVQEGFVFTEGPLGAPDGGFYFTDLRGANRIHRVDPAGKVSVFRENSNGTNGLALTRAGQLVGVEGAGKRVVRFAPDGSSSALLDGATTLMSPNDLIADAKGGLYFTDPGPRPLVTGRKAYVYYLPAGASKAIALDDTITRPNGLTLTLDDKTLIVADTVGSTLFAFDVQADAMLRNKRAYATLRDIPEGKESGADGIAIDRDGRLYVTTLTGIQVFDRSGGYLGTIAVPRQPANVAFGGPGKRVMLVTAREAVYRIQMLSAGPARPGK